MEAALETLRRHLHLPKVCLTLRIPLAAAVRVQVVQLSIAAAVVAGVAGPRRTWTRTTTSRVWTLTTKKTRLRQQHPLSPRLRKRRLFSQTTKNRSTSGSRQGRSSGVLLERSASASVTWPPTVEATPDPVLSARQVAPTPRGPVAPLAICNLTSVMLLRPFRVASGKFLRSERCPRQRANRPRPRPTASSYFG